MGAVAVGAPVAELECRLSGLLLGGSLFRPGRFARTVRGQDTQTFGYAQLLLKF